MSESAREFYLEDTSDECYRDVTSALYSRGWIRRQEQKSNAKSTGSRRKDELIWTIDERGLRFTTSKYTLYNHFEGMHQTLTTKKAFCDTLRDSTWVFGDVDCLCPRTYNLGEASQREEFIETFKICAVLRVLRSLASMNPIAGAVVVDEHLLSLSIQAATRYLGRRASMRSWTNNSWEDIIAPEPYACFLGVSEDDWKAILSISYALAVDESSVCLPQHDAFNGPRGVKIAAILKEADKESLLAMSGRNVWIVKAAEACRGVGLRLFYKLEDILESGRLLGARVVQKYVEAPLLAPRTDMEGTAFISNGLAAAPAVKFDLRVWVLVTSFNPLRSFVYSHVYGRRCSAPFVLDVARLNDQSAHLTNYSVQKSLVLRQPLGSSSGSGGSGGGAVGSRQIGVKASPRVRQLLLSKITSSLSMGHPAAAYLGRRKQETEASESVVDSMRRMGDLFLSHERVLEIVGRCSQRPEFWKAELWPHIKHKILTTLLLAQQRESLVHREGCFEFLGYDVIIDDKLQPLILEVNMTPAMAHRNNSQNAEIENMARGLVDIVMMTKLKEKSNTSGCNADDPTREGFPPGYPNASQSRLGTWEELLSVPGASMGDIAPPCPEQILKKENDLDAFMDETIDESDGDFAVNDHNPNASALRLLRASRSCFVSRLDMISFAVEGRNISAVAIGRIDSIIAFQEKRELLERWAKRFVPRRRLFHRMRVAFVVYLQRIVRCWRFRRACLQRRKCMASIRLQRAARMWIARRRLASLRANSAAVVVQRNVRRRIAWHLCRRMRRNEKAVYILLWCRRMKQRRCNRAAFKIRKVVLVWLKRRCIAVKIIARLVRLFFEMRLHAALRIKRAARGWLRWRKICRCSIRRWLLLYMRRKKSILCIQRYILAWIGKARELPQKIEDKGNGRLQELADSSNVHINQNTRRGPLRREGLCHPLVLEETIFRDFACLSVTAAAEQVNESLSYAAIENNPAKSRCEYKPSRSVNSDIGGIDDFIWKYAEMTDAKEASVNTDAPRSRSQCLDGATSSGIDSVSTVAETSFDKPSLTMLYEAHDLSVQALTDTPTSILTSLRRASNVLSSPANVAPPKFGSSRNARRRLRPAVHSSAPGITCAHSVITGASSSRGIKRLTPTMAPSPSLAPRPYSNQCRAASPQLVRGLVDGVYSSSRPPSVSAQMTRTRVRLPNAATSYSEPSSLSAECPVDHKQMDSDTNTTGALPCKAARIRHARSPGARASESGRSNRYEKKFVRIIDSEGMSSYDSFIMGMIRACGQK